MPFPEKRNQQRYGKNAPKFVARTKKLPKTALLQGIYSKDDKILGLLPSSLHPSRETERIIRLPEKLFVHGSKRVMRSMETPLNSSRFSVNTERWRRESKMLSLDPAMFIFGVYEKQGRISIGKTF